MILKLLKRIAASREPDVYIGGRENPYMKRWWVIPRNRLFNIYLHHFLRSDWADALHDHPWINCSILLEGKYTEHTIAKGGVHHRKEYKACDVKLRGSKFAHRVELTDGPVWTLFITGPVVRDWGFLCPHGWRSHHDFIHGDRSCD